MYDSVAVAWCPKLEYIRLTRSMALGLYAWSLHLDDDIGSAAPRLEATHHESLTLAFSNIYVSK